MICPYCRRPLANPDERFCTGCGGDLHVAPPIPAEPGAAPAPLASPGYGGGGPRAASGTPWEQRAQLGLPTAFLETTKGVLGAPVEFFGAMPTSGGIGDPLFYGVLAGYIGLVANSVYRLVMHLVMGGSAMVTGDSPAERIFASMQGGFGFLQFVLQLVIGPLLIPVVLFIGAGIYHLSLMLLGGANKDFEATLRVVSYSQATALLQIVPFCGPFVAGIWGLVANVFGLSEAHGISRGKAVAAVLLPIALICCCCVGGLMLMFGGIAGLTQR